MRVRLLLRSVPALLVAGPALALPNDGLAPEPGTPATAEQPLGTTAERARPQPSAAFLEAARLGSQGDETAKPAAEGAAEPAPAPAPEPPPDTKKHKKGMFNVFAFYEDRELDELTVDFDDDDTDMPDIDFNDTEHTRYGLGAAFGNKSVNGYVKLFGDELTFKDGAGNTLEFEGFGGGGGVAGSPTLSEFNPDTHLTLPYRCDLTLAFDTADALVPGGNDLDLFYLENRLEVGIGLNWKGLHPSLGVQATSSLGYVTDDLDDADESNDATITGFNPGFYAGIAYKHPEFPLWLDLRFLGGDVSGWTGALGASF